MSFFDKVRRNLMWKRLSSMKKDPHMVVFQSYYGRGYSDSPRAIAEELRKRGGFKLYWIVKSAEEAKSLPPEIVPLVIDSPEAIKLQCEAKFWVDNCRKWAYTQKGEGQFYIQTWHGFPLKRIEKDAESSLPPDYIKAARKDSQMCDLMLSNSSFLTEIYRSGFWYAGDVIECGFPRNDVLVNGDESMKAKAREALSLSEKTKYLLYAPTFRKGMGLEVYDMAYDRVIAALEEKFGGEWKILAKLHPNVADKAKELKLDSKYVINASDYPDILDLYLLSDAMVSDYSSVMFDYMLTKKPCFLYVNDLESYAGDRNFYFDIKKLPFDAAEGNDKLVELINAFDAERQAEKIAEFNEEFRMNETGKAAVSAADIIERKAKE